jgi:hypothetical protein
MPAGKVDKKFYNQKKRELEYGWTQIRMHIEKVINSGERSFPRIVNSLLALWQADDGHFADVTDYETYFDGKLYNISAFNRYTMERFNVSYNTSKLIDIIEPDCERIVETGSGWSRNLFNLWLNGGPKNAEYISLEFVDMARWCAQIIGVLEPELDLKTYPFDYYKPDFSSFSGETKKGADLLKQRSCDVFCTFRQKSNEKRGHTR